MIEKLKQKLVIIGTKSKTKDKLLMEISKLASKNCGKLNHKVIYKAFLKREEQSSTGLTQGLAIPHCTFEELSDFHVGVVVIKDGIDFDSLDGELTKIIFFSVGPKDQQNQHIATLTAVSKIAADNQLLDQVLNIKKPLELYNLLHGENS